MVLRVSRGVQCFQGGSISVEQLAVLDTLVDESFRFWAGLRGQSHPNPRRRKYGRGHE